MEPGVPEEIVGALGEVNYGTGSERREAGKDSAVVSATVRVLATSVSRSLTAEDQLRLDGAVWDIASVVPFGRREMDITATRRI